MISRHAIQSIGRDLLAENPNPVVGVRILRDVLCVPASDPRLAAARAGLMQHPWVLELAKGQQPDGSWGRFHSMDSSLKRRFPTSEIAIRRALALGLDKSDPLLAGAVRYMEAVLSGRQSWSDRAEKSEGWPIIVQAITAGTLAQVDPGHTAIGRIRDYWAEVAGRAFPGGSYDPQAERLAHRLLCGRELTYLGSRYVLTLLGACSRDLPAALNRQIQNWAWSNPAGIGYLGVPLVQPEVKTVITWLESLAILAPYPQSIDFIRPGLEWLWAQRNPAERWDFGPRTGKSPDLPLSDNWRKRGGRAIDHTTCVLSLLGKFT